MSNSMKTTKAASGISRWTGRITTNRCSGRTSIYASSTCSACVTIPDQDDVAHRGVIVRPGNSRWLRASRPACNVATVAYKIVLQEPARWRWDSRWVLGATPGRPPASYHLSQSPPSVPAGGGFIFNRLDRMPLVAECAVTDVRHLDIRQCRPQKGGSIWNNSRHPGSRAPMLEFVIIKRGRSWHWRLRDQNGTTIMGGREKTRPAARYHACRALFLLIATGWKATDLQRS